MVGDDNDKSDKSDQHRNSSPDVYTRKSKASAPPLSSLLLLKLLLLSQLL